ncbi:MAG: 16S rRNA (cytidine(1402)-2'-O)-methyltransferase [Actinomycetota bacterium]
MPGILYVTATPIGNLEDLGPRAERILREAAVIAAEDTRVTRGLLARYDIHTPLTSYHAHTGSGKTDALVERLLAGEDVALVSDAGTPGVSDPGAALVSAALAAGVTVTPIPGPSAVITALSASGLDAGRFLFQGFLPRSRGAQRKVLETLRPLPHTLVFYEAPGRLGGTLGILHEVLGDRRAVVARELSKKFEEFVRGSLLELATRYEAQPARGECVILVSGIGDEEQAAPDAATLDSTLRELIAGGASVRDAARAVAERCGAPRREAYAQAQAIATELRGD